MAHINDQIQAAKEEFLKTGKLTPQIIACLFADLWGPYGFADDDKSQVVDGVITIAGPKKTPVITATFEVLDSTPFDRVTDS